MSNKNEFEYLSEKNLLKTERMDGFNKTRRLYLGKIIINDGGKNDGLKKHL